MNNLPSLEWIEQMIDSDDLEGADVALCKLEKVVKAAQPTADDENEMDETDDTDDEDTEDEEDDGIEKLGPGRRIRYPQDPSHAGLTYPEDDLTDAFESHENIGANTRPSVHPGTGGGHHITVDARSDATPFDHHVAHVKRRDGVSRIQALTTARRERPDLFRDHQAQTGSVEQVHAHRRAMNKSEHVHGDTCYEDMVAIECSKGFSPELAAQRVLHQYGDRLPHRNDEMAKAADSVIVKFMRRCDQIMIEKRCDRTTAMRFARQENEDLFGAFQTV